ncbi:MAG: lipoprotein, partial [Erysipelotrichaceae bacterium]|nr:lipoprotein [Erysipelotrichaceae bacterium]
MRKTVLILLALLLLAGCSTKKYKYDQPETPSCDMSGYDLQTDVFHQLTLQQLYDAIDAKKTMIVLLSHITCPWCQALVPVVDEVAKGRELGIYYIDADREFLNDERLLKMCQEIENKTAIDEEGNPCLYLPSILYIRKGILIDIHVGTVSGHDASAM